MEFQEKVINKFPDYSINTLGEVKNIQKGNILKLFDTFYIDLYKQENDKPKKTRYRVKLSDLMIEHFILKEHQTIDRIYIQYKDRNLCNNSLSNLKPKLVSFFTYKMFDNKWMLYDSYTKTFQIVDKLPLKHKIFYVLFKDYDYTESGLLKFVCDFRQWTKEILKSLRINYEYGYSHTLSIDLIIKKLCPKSLFEHEPIDRIEYIWMEKATKSPFMFCIPGTYKSYGYDFKSCYAYVMSQKSFKIPTKKGKEILLKELPIEIKFGYYHVLIKSDNSESHKIFRFNVNNIYTHMSLKFALKYANQFNFEINLIHDDKPNAYIYENDSLETGETLFSNYYSKIIDTRKLYPDNKLCKFLLSSLWGTLSRQYKKQKTDEQLQEQDITIGMDTETYDNIFIDEDFEGNNKYVDISKPYVHNIRLKTWLKSSVNNIMASIFIKMGTTNIIRCHTDGFSSLIEKGFEMENLMADKKYTGTFDYQNVNNILPIN